MEVLNLVFGIILLVAAVFLVVAVLMQSGKSHNLSGSIAGGAETFFGKTKGKSIDKVLSKVTTIVAILFVVLVVVVYVIQPNDNANNLAGDTTEHVHVEGEDHDHDEEEPAPENNDVESDGANGAESEEPAPENNDVESDGANGAESEETDLAPEA